MKTYTKKVTLEEPRLIIWPDMDAYSPRHDDTLGYFITCERRNDSPDNTDSTKWVYDIVKETGDEAKNTLDHMRLIKERLETELGHHEEVIEIFPVKKYEHGGVAYSIGTDKGGDFDTSNCGFYIVTKAKQEHMGIKKKEIREFVEDEIKRYNKWANGEVLGYTLFDSKGQELECCGSFYELEEIGEHICSNYPSEAKEWENERLEDYITHE